MKTLRVLAACALLSSAPPSPAQISAGVGHQLKEKASDGTEVSHPDNPAGDFGTRLSEGRAAAPAVDDKPNNASCAERGNQEER